MENIAEVSLLLIDSAFWKYQAIKTAFSEITTLVYILTLPVLSTCGHWEYCGLMSV